MKKNTKLLIGSAVLVGILGAALTAVLLIPSGNEEIKLSDKNEILIFDKTGLIPEEITVSNTGGDYQLLAFDYEKSSKTSSSSSDTDESAAESTEANSEDEEVTIVYTMQDHPDMLLDKNVTDSLVKQCLTQSARELIDRSGSKDKEYGLETPVSTVRIRYSDSSTETLYLGNEAPSGQGVYMKTSRSKNVYLVHSSLTDTFYIEKLQLFDKQVTPYFEDMTNMTITGKNYSEDIVIGRNEYSCYDGYYLMTSPARYQCSNEKVNEISTPMSELKAVWIADINVGEDDLKKYGLDNPYEKIEIKADGGTNFTLIASEPDSENIFYLMNTSGTTVYRTYANENKWLGLKKTDLLTNSIIEPSSTEIAKAVIKAEGKSYDYIFTKTKGLDKNYYETENVTVKYNGEEINIAKISNFISNVSGLEWSDKKPGNLDGCSEILSVEYSYFVDEGITDRLVLMRDSAGKTIAVLNGKAECYVDSAYADRLAAQVDKIPTAEIIDLFKDSEA